MYNLYISIFLFLKYKMAQTWDKLWNMIFCDR
jgi:hypothetical protein